MRGILRRSSIAFSLTTVVSGQAYAGPLPDPVSITVAVSADDFATEAATRALTKRLESAARQVCKGESWSDDGYLFTRACNVTALQDALEQRNRLRLGGVTSLTAASIVVGARQ